MRRYTFPDKPIIPEKTFREAMDEIILDRIRKKAREENKKETEGEKVKEFLDQFSTKIGEDK